jgi:hypothetical protein
MADCPYSNTAALHVNPFVTAGGHVTFRGRLRHHDLGIISHRSNP